MDDDRERKERLVFDSFVMGGYMRDLIKGSGLDAFAGNLPDLERRLLDAFQESIRTTVSPYLGNGVEVASDSLRTFCSYLAPVSVEEIVRDGTDQFLVRNVFYRNALYDVAIDKSLLDNGSTHGQDWWLDRANGYSERVGDVQLQMAVILALYENRLKQAANSSSYNELKGMLLKDYRHNWMMTSTRSRFKAKDPDKIIHGYNTSHALLPIETTLVGTNGHLVNVPDDTSIAVLGTTSRKTNDAFKWLSGREGYQWSYSERPSEDIKCAVVLGVYDYWFDVSVGGYYGPARGWSARENGGV